MGQITSSLEAEND